MEVGQDDARHYWDRIADHWLSMQERLGTKVNLRVALLDYFMAVRPRLKNPKIVEMSVFDRTEAAVYRDELTGLYNYRFFTEQLERELARCERANTPMSVAMIDIDNFKSYNDHGGHDAGNRVLETLGILLTESLRREDIAARYGGEEFALIMPGTPKAGAQVAAESVRSRVAQHRFGAEDLPPEQRITVSIGIATFPADATDGAELLRRADSAMYLAKSSGKNQVQLFAQSCRSHCRVEASLEGKFRFVNEESHPLTTLRISGGGMLFVSDRRLAPGMLVEIDLKLPPAGREVVVPGRVIGVEPRKAGGFEVAVTVEGFDRQDRTALGQYVRETSRSRAGGVGT
jgi:diguanylate cyclase (GGDEF)-like protein